MSSLFDTHEFITKFNKKMNKYTLKNESFFLKNNLKLREDKDIYENVFKINNHNEDLREEYISYLKFKQKFDKTLKK